MIGMVLQLAKLSQQLTAAIALQNTDEQRANAARLADLAGQAKELAVAPLNRAVVHSQCFNFLKVKCFM